MEKGRRRSSLFRSLMRKKKQPTEEKEESDGPKIEIIIEHRKLSLFHTCSILISSLGGGGIFIGMATLVAYTGSIAMTLFVVLLTGLLNYSLSLCFTEVATLIPKAGGPYFFLFKMFGEFPAFMFMWGFIIFIIAPAWGISAFSASLYIVQLFFPGCRPPDDAVKLLALCILSLIVALNCVYMRYVMRVQTFLSTCKLIAMVIILSGGGISAARGQTENYEYILEGTNTEPGNMALSVLNGMFIYGGWQIVTFLLEEVESPEKNVPRAIALSFAVNITCNILTVAAYFLLISPREMLDADAVAVLFMKRLYFPLAPAISVFVTCTNIGSLNAIVLAQSRLVTAVAQRHHLPAILGTTSEKYNMPWAASIFLWMLSSLVLYTGSVMTLIEMISFFATVMSLSVLMCLFALRVRQPHTHRPIKVWLGTAIFQFALSTAILAMSIYQKPHALGLIALILISGVPVYMVGVRWRQKPEVVNRCMEKITVFMQKLLILKYS